jgi:RimJ/RimL family protein N-acetyltransferase
MTSIDVPRRSDTGSVKSSGGATEALIVVTDHAFANHDLCRVYAHVFDWNPASARVLEKAGYTFEGRLRKSVTKEGQTIDQLMYAMIRE